MQNQQLIIEKGPGTATVWLNREEVRNAFDEALITQLIEVLEDIEKDDNCRVILIRGRGTVFCAGADINWMKKAIDYSPSQNLAESRQLSLLLYKLYTFPKPTIAIVHGAAIGGGIGLLSACDFVFAEKETRFSFSEVSIGLVPACIAPYAIKRIGAYQARQLMLTGKPFEAIEAVNIGLADFFGTKSTIEVEVNKLVEHLIEAGPQAVVACKKLIRNVADHWSLAEASENTAKMIAEIRSTNEAQEGMRSFLEKRKPSWKHK